MKLNDLLNNIPIQAASCDLTAEASAFVTLAPARGNGTLSFSAPDGGALPATAEAVYYSRVKGT